MLQIIITSPGTLPEEDIFIPRLIDRGAFAIHLRKPEWSTSQYAALINKIPEDYHRYLVLHDHFDLCCDYNLKGVHLNRRNPVPPQNHKGSLSCSCHSFEEVVKMKPLVDYMFLSPIFNSISKQGYMTAFTDSQLTQAAKEGIIDNKVIALGGITPNHVSTLEQWHFGGYAMLGCVWGNIELYI